MKKYLFTDEANTWWAEYWVDGMKTQDNQTILSIKSRDTNGVINHTDLFDFMTHLGLPNKVGARFTHAEWLTMATTLSLRMLMTYESDSTEVNRSSTSKDILAFNFPAQGQVGESVINTTAGTIAINVETSTVLTALVATFELSEFAFMTQTSNDQVSGVTELDYSSPVTFTVWSETPIDGKEFIATVLRLVAAPTSVTLAVGSVTPVAGVTNVVVPVDGATDTTGAVAGWVASSAGKIKITVVNAASTASTLTINGGAYTSGADYDILAATPLTVVLTSTRSGYKTCVRTFTIAVAAL
jgi:hypothetical protein